MTLAHAILFGAIEGLTEFLPVSSTAHLILASRILGLPQTDVLKAFEVIIQLGAILAVIVLYGRTVLRERAVLLRVLAAFVPTAIIGFFLRGLVKDVFFESVPLILWALFLGGIALIVFERFHREEPGASDDLATLSYRTAILIGVWQSLALIPGVSRAAATIVGGLLLGMRRKSIVDFSFLLAVPTMLAASASDAFDSYELFSAQDVSALVVGFVVSFAVAMVSILWLLRFIKTHTFSSFGMYRILLAAAMWIILVRGIMR